jgi:hypothetical protein
MLIGGIHQGVVQGDDAGGADAVVIGEQNAHGAEGSVGSSSRPI